jgi:septum formation protein
MLEAADVKFAQLLPDVDEATLKLQWQGQRLGPGEIALGLAEAKANSVMQQGISALILGSDQILVTANGDLLSKAESMGELAEQLRSLSGRTHRLFSAAAIVENWAVVWTAVEQARMTMRYLSDEFIANYLASEGKDLLGCVGGYRIEGRGAQLFEKVEGSQFVVQGLPLLPLLGYLRDRGVMSA